MARYVIDGGAYMSSLLRFGQYALRMTCRPAPKMLIIDTVAEPGLSVMTRIQRHFAPLTKEIRQLHLNLRGYEMKTIRRWFSWADLIYFPENDLDHDIPIWTKRHLHELVVEVFERDSAVLFASGCSGLWLFEKGFVPKNDTHHFLDSMLDLQHSLFIPHFEEMDQSALELEIGKMRSQGYALESNTALAHNCGTECFLATSEEDKAYRFIETPRWIMRKDVPMTIID